MKTLSGIAVLRRQPAACRDVRQGSPPAGARAASRRCTWDICDDGQVAEMGAASSYNAAFYHRPRTLTTYQRL
jgi:hypothetical protein